MFSTTLRTAEQAEANLKSARAELARLTEEGLFNWEHLAKQVNQVAEYSGALAVARVTDQISQGADPAGVLDHLLTAVLQGADDTWSGRNNDTRRAYFDGYREAVRDSEFALKRLIKDNA